MAIRGKYDRYGNIYKDYEEVHKEPNQPKQDQRRGENKKPDRKKPDPKKADHKQDDDYSSSSDDSDDYDSDSSSGSSSYSSDEDRHDGHMRANCRLCLHRIEPLAATDVLDCGHIYHRECLKMLLDLSTKSSVDKRMFCNECRKPVDENLVNQFKLAFRHGLNDPGQLDTDDKKRSKK